MRKLAAFVLAAATLGLAGCASGGGFVETVRSEIPEVLDQISEDDLVAVGEAVCDALDDGLSGHRAAGELEASGFTLAEAGTIVLAASDHLCPQHASTVN